MNDLPPTEEGASALAFAWRFARESWLLVVGVSSLVLVPCFWHREIVAADLGSHLYNAWLAQRISRGELPGLWLARQWSNVLFDYLLTALAHFLTWHATEIAAVSLAVLIFFWGMFALASAAARRAPWTLTPLLAIFTYGWTFHMGFFNYYLSLGISFFAIAIVWRGLGAERLVALALAPLIYLAHPLGLLWFVGAALYVTLAQFVRPRFQIFVLLAGAGVLAALHAYLWLHFIVEPSPFRFYQMNGADQVLLFGDRYLWISRALIAFAIVSLALDAWRSRRDPERWKEPGIVLQMFLLALLAVPLLPRGVHLSESTAAVALLTDRLTSATAALGCCLLATMRPAKWHFGATLAIAAAFFAVVYVDTAVVNAMEAQAVRLVRTIPPDSRVLATILPLGDSRVPIQHMIDRACVARCFSYGNYEPGSRLFRVRTNGYNPYVLEDYDLAVDMEEGAYTVRAGDLPIWQVYQCDETETRLCIHALAEDEDNDRVGIHPDD